MESTAWTRCRAPCWAAPKTNQANRSALRKGEQAKNVWAPYQAPLLNFWLRFTRARHPKRSSRSTPPKRSSRMPAPVDPTQLYGSRPAPSTRLPTGAAAPEAVDISDLNFLLNAGPSSKRSARAAAQEEHKKVLPPPTGNELRVMSVQQAVDALIEHVNVDSVVRGCCERWQALGYGPGRRQSAAEAGALAAGRLAVARKEAAAVVVAA